MNGLSDMVLLTAALLGAGAAAGFASGLFGIGGGFVVVPALLLILPMLGTDGDALIHVAVGTSLATIIVTSLRSAQSHARRGAVDFAFIRGWAPWVALGTIAGIMLADRVSGPTLAIIFGVGVMLFAIQFLTPGLQDRRLLQAMPVGATRAGLAGGLGMISALLGIGGGTITTVVMTLCGAPIHRAIGTASGMGAIIAVPGAIGFAMIGAGAAGLPQGSIGYVNLPAAGAIVAMSILTAPLGVAAAHRLSPAVLRTVFGLYLAVVGVTMIANG